MDAEGKDRLADELLEASLRQLRSENPRPGLEARILAGARAAEQAARRRAGWVWAWGAAAGLAVVVIVVSLAHLNHVPVLRRAPSSAPVAAAKPGAPPVALVGERSAFPPAGRSVASQGQLGHPSAGTGPRAVPRFGGRQRGAARGTLVARRPDQFPNPLPLTQEEKLLVAFVEANPQSHLLALDGQDREINIPLLSVAAIEIKPLPAPIEEQAR